MAVKFKSWIYRPYDRKNAPEKGSFPAFILCKRMYGQDLNRRALESLIKCGALDDLGCNRRQMLASVTMILDTLEADKRKM